MGLIPKIIPNAKIAIAAKSNIAATVSDDARRFISIQRVILSLYFPTIYTVMLARSHTIAIEGRTMIAIVNEICNDSQNKYVPIADPADKSRAAADNAAKTAPTRGVFFTF